MNRDAARDNLIRTLIQTLERLGGNVKTVAYYQRVLDRDVRELYAGRMDEGAFVDDMVRLIDEQFDRAWNEGARENGIEPADEKPEWLQVLDDRKLQELDYVEKFARDIVDAAKRGDSIDPLRARVPMWAARYDEVAAMARVVTGEDKKFEWVLGATEQHCESNGSTYGCRNLSGVVAFGRDWAEAGVHPQSSTTTCGGFNCDCSLVPTSKPITAGGIPGK